MIEVIKHKTIENSSLKAVFDIKIPKWGNFIIRELKLFEKDGNFWVSFPSKEYEKDGKKKYYELNCFEDIETKSKFEKQIIEAINSHVPTSLETQTSKKYNPQDITKVPF